MERVDIVHNRPCRPRRCSSTSPRSRATDTTSSGSGSDFRRLLDTGLLDDLRLEVGDGATGKIVVFDVTERRRIRCVEYRGSRQLSGGRHRAPSSRPAARTCAPTRSTTPEARKAEAAIREMLARKGRPFATVLHEARDAGPAGADLSSPSTTGPGRS